MRSSAPKAGSMESSGPTATPEPGDGPPSNGGLPPSAAHDYPLTFSVDYPDRELDRLSSALRIFWVIPIAIVAATIEGGSFSTGSGARYAGGSIGLLVVPVVLMLL